MNNFIKRVFTAIFLAIFVIFAIVFNKYTKFLMILFFSTISIYELNNALKKINLEAIINYAYIFNAIFLLLASKLNIDIAFPIFTIYNLSLIIILVLDGNMNLYSIFANIFFAVYISFPYAYLLFLDKYWTIFAFAITSFTDTFAYLIGMTIGKTKLIERLSPNKTVEGSIWGIVGGLILSFLFVEIFNIGHRPLIYMFSIIISIVSQIGDLFASYIKRKSNIKDYGNILIGHGGIMDRFDSLLLVAPLVYILVYNLG